MCIQQLSEGLVRNVDYIRLGDCWGMEKEFLSTVLVLCCIQESDVCHLPLSQNKQIQMQCL